jgi:Zn-dependent protease with chaperone function
VIFLRVSALVLFLLVIGGQGAFAQSVRITTHTHGSTRRSGEQDAEKAGFSAWPLVKDGGQGTAVHVSFDYWNADAVILCYPMLSRQQMLEIGRSIARDMGTPKTDFVLLDDLSYSSIDLEFNDYIVAEGKKHRMEVDVSKLSKALLATELPRPICIRVKPNDADLFFVGNPPKHLDEKQAVFFNAESVPMGTTAVFEATATWAGYLTIAVFGLGFLWVFSFLFTSPWRMEKLRKKAQKTSADAPKLSPEELQAKYDKGKSAWFTQILVFLPAILILGGKNIVEAGFRQAFRVARFDVPDFRYAFLGPIVIFGGVMLLSRGLYFLDRKRRASADPSLLDPLPLPESEALKPMRTLMLLMLLPVLLMIGLTFIPGLRTMDDVTRRVTIFGTLFGGWIIAGSIGFYLARKARPARQAGDWVYDIAAEYARAAGVTLRRVETRTATEANAYATLFGTVGVTTGLLEMCDRDEVKAIIAHEIGHLKAKHLAKLLPITFLFTFGVIALKIYLTKKLEGRIPDGIYAVLESPVLAWVVLPVITAFVFGPRRRKNELEADAFAADMIGDPELVARALSKIHHINQTPGRLKPHDEALSSHPSLEKRVAHVLEREAPEDDLSRG